MLYIVMAERGYFDREDLKSLRQIDSHLQGHPCAHKTPGIDLSTGPLGLDLESDWAWHCEKLKQPCYYLCLWEMVRSRKV